MQISVEVTGHLSQMFDEVEAAIRNFPNDLWHRKGVKGMMIPAVLAAHAVWCIRLRHLLNIPLNKLPSRKRVPTQEQLVAILDAIRAHTVSVYGRMDDATYLAKEGTGAAPISRVIYAIAHTRHHLGQLVQILKENGIKPPKWYPR